MGPLRLLKLQMISDPLKALIKALILTASLFASLSPAIANASQDAVCFGTYVEVNSSASESALTDLFEQIRGAHPLANLQPAKRSTAPLVAEGSAVAYYSSHTEFKCASELLNATGAQRLSSRLDRSLPAGTVKLIWNEKSPVLYGAQNQL